MPHNGELTTAHGTRLHIVQAPVGHVHVEYAATIVGRLTPATPTEVDLFRYLRPSRCCESDSLGPTAHSEFAGLAGSDVLDAVTSWVGTRLTYVPRALDVPARLVAVYAPGLDPMDFRAVVDDLSRDDLDALVSLG